MAQIRLSHDHSPARGASHLIQGNPACLTLAWRHVACPETRHCSPGLYGAAVLQLCTPKDEIPAAEGASGEGPAPKERFSCHDYCLQGFKCLVDLARCHSEGGAPVRWGWSR